MSSLLGWVLLLAMLGFIATVIIVGVRLGRRLQERTDALTQQTLALTRQETALNRNTAEVTTLRQLLEALTPGRATFAPEILQAEPKNRRVQSTELVPVRLQPSSPSGEATIAEIVRGLTPDKQEQLMGMWDRVRQRVNDPQEPTLGHSEPGELVSAGAPAD